MIKRRLYGCITFFAGIVTAFVLKRNNRCQDEEREKYYLYYNLLNNWMKQKEKGESIAEKLQQRGIQEIAVYGMGDIAKHLQNELSGTNIIVKYAIDKSILSVIDIDTYFPDSELPKVDAVIVTPIMDYENIYSLLRKKMSCPIICIRD